MKRIDGRKADEIRSVNIVKDFMPNAHGSCLIECGRTRVLCTAMLTEGTPPFLEGTNQGWLTAEYAMLPGSTIKRKQREGLKQDGRSTEIKRLIGRSLRAITNFEALGENTMYIDCDVIEADGGTRTASITGSFVAYALAVDRLIKCGILTKSPIREYVAAVSCGVVEDTVLLDLCYAEDSMAQADMNIVLTAGGGIVEAQCTGEKRPVTEAELEQLMALGKKGIGLLLQKQAAIIDSLDVVTG
jgi:ribonuclease PH